MRLIVHDGKSIPEAYPKDPDSDTWYGFEYVLRDGELILSDSWMINDTPVSPGDIVNGLEYVGKSSTTNVTKVNVRGGKRGVRYLVSNVFATNMTSRDVRSMYLTCDRL